MKIQINIEKKYAFMILSVVLIFGGAIAVYATWDTAKTLWHSASDVKVNIAGADYSLQEAVNSGGKICRSDGTNCGGVTSISAGTGITVSSGTGAVTVSSTLNREDQHCSVVQTGLSSTGCVVVDMKVNGVNICETNWGCSYRAWEYTSDYPQGNNLYNTYAVPFRQVASKEWIDASGNQRGKNGDATSTALFTGFGDGGNLYDDSSASQCSGTAESDSANQLVFKDNSNSRGYIVAFCDR